MDMTIRYALDKKTLFDVGARLTPGYDSNGQVDLAFELAPWKSAKLKGDLHYIDMDEERPDRHSARGALAQATGVWGTRVQLNGTYIDYDPDKQKYTNVSAGLGKTFKDKDTSVDVLLGAKHIASPNRISAHGHEKSSQDEYFLTAKGSFGGGHATAETHIKYNDNTLEDGWGFMAKGGYAFGAVESDRRGAVFSLGAQGVHYTYGISQFGVAAELALEKPQRLRIPVLGASVTLPEGLNLGFMAGAASEEAGKSFLPSLRKGDFIGRFSASKSFDLF